MLRTSLCSRQTSQPYFHQHPHILYMYLEVEVEQQPQVVGRTSLQTLLISLAQEILPRDNTE